MNQIHDRLGREYSWYSKWHKVAEANKFHWSAFVAIAFVSVTILSSAIEINTSRISFLASSASSGKQKIDRSIEALFKKDETSLAPVIIRMNLPFKRFYEKGDNNAKKATKIKSFNDTKKVIQYELGKNGSVRDNLPIVNGFLANINKKGFEALKNNPNVASVDLDIKVSTVLDTSVSEINATQVYDLLDSSGNVVTGKGVRIAVIDTGVDYTHPDLGGCIGANCKVIGGYDFFNNDSDPMDDHGHGTHVAATAAGKGVLNGVAPDAKILAYKVLNAGGAGSLSTVIAGINRAVDPNNDGNSSDHVDIISMSLGGDCGGYYDSVCGPGDSASIAVDNATAVGVSSIVGAGNAGSGASTVTTPGTAGSAVTVAASCKASQIGSNTHCVTPIALFSSRGPVFWNANDYQKPDVSAPGVMICAAQWGTSFGTTNRCIDDKHVRISGTSMATPHVAGAAALLKQLNPSYSPAQIKSLLKYTAKNLGQNYDAQGAGLINVKEAATISLDGAVSTPSEWSLSTGTIQNEFSQTFSVTARSGINNLSVNFVPSSSGITMNFDKTSLNVSGGVSDSFTATASLNTNSYHIYYGTIRLNENGVLKAVIPVTIEIPETIPGVPQNVHAKDATIYWSPMTNASLGFNVKRSTVSGGPYTIIANPKGSPYMDTTQVPGTIYYYVVSAVNTAGEGPNSPEFTPTISPAPVAPIDLHVYRGLNHIGIGWMPGSSPWPSNYKIKRGTSPGVYNKTMYSGGWNSYRDLDVATGTKYYYSISGLNVTGAEGPAAPEVSAIPGIPLEGPSNVRAEVLSNSSVRISWTPPPNPNTPDNYNYPLIYYKIRNGTTAGGPYSTWTNSMSTSTSFVWNSPSFTGTTQYFAISSITGLTSYNPVTETLENYQVEGPNSAEVSATFGGTPIGGDKTPPTVSITNPKSGSTISGTAVSITATATDNVKVAKVEFYVNGVLKVSDNKSPYEYRWSINKEKAGLYTIIAKAYDTAGNVASSTSSVTKN